MLRCFQHITKASYDSKNQLVTKKERKKINDLLGLACPCFAQRSTLPFYNCLGGLWRRKRGKIRSREAESFSDLQ